VTGAGRGVGRGVALLMAEEGAKVVVNDLGAEVDGTGSSHEPADGVVAEIRARGGEASANYDNIALMDGGEAVIQQAVDQYGQLDVLVNSAGMLRDRMIFQMTPDDWDRVLRNNTKAAFTTCKYAAIIFRQQRSGRIVNMVSDAGLGDVGRSNYSAASEGIVGLTRTVGRDLGRYGVTANAISPMAETRLFPGSVDEHRVADAPGPSRDERAGIGPSPLWVIGKARAGPTILRMSRHWRCIFPPTLPLTLTDTSSASEAAVSTCTRTRRLSGRYSSGATSTWKRWTFWSQR